MIKFNIPSIFDMIIYWRDMTSIWIDLLHCSLSIFFQVLLFYIAYLVPKFPTPHPTYILQYIIHTTLKRAIRFSLTKTLKRFSQHHLLSLNRPQPLTLFRILSSSIERDTAGHPWLPSLSLIFLTPPPLSSLFCWGGTSPASSQTRRPPLNRLVLA